MFYPNTVYRCFHNTYTAFLKHLMAGENLWNPSKVMLNFLRTNSSWSVSDITNRKARSVHWNSVRGFLVREHSGISKKDLSLSSTMQRTRLKHLSGDRTFLLKDLMYLVTFLWSSKLLSSNRGRNPSSKCLLQSQEIPKRKQLKRSKCSCLLSTATSITLLRKADKLDICPLFALVNPSESWFPDRNSWKTNKAAKNSWTLRWTKLKNLVLLYPNLHSGTQVRMPGFRRASSEVI